VVRFLPGTQVTGSIREVLPRRSVLLRRAAGRSHQEQAIAANLDVLFLCMSLNQDYNPRRLERALSITWASGIQPVVILTKADLCPTWLPKRMEETQHLAGEADVYAISCLEPETLESLRRHLGKGRLVAFIGSSGVGKSTIINQLLGEDRLDTAEIRKDGKGRHTTTARQLFMLPDDAGMAIDTPGIRELGMWDAPGGVGRTFEDIEELALQCRFSDCRHQNEPGCAIKRALKNGQLEEERWLSYCKLQEESDFAAYSNHHRAAQERKFSLNAKKARDSKRPSP
jgi:ribosome biogenesis GTPase